MFSSQGLQAGQKAPYKFQSRAKTAVGARPAGTHERPAWKPASAGSVSSASKVSASCRTKSGGKTGGYSGFRGASFSGTRSSGKLPLSRCV